MNRRRRLAVLALLGLGIIIGGSLYVAISSNPRPAQAVGPMGIEISSIDLAIGPGSATLSASNMAPGDTVGAAITVTNSGRDSMTYGMKLGLISVSGVALAAALILTVRTVGTSCADFDGAVLFEGPLDDATFGLDGAQRPLPAASADILCFRASLPLATGNALQGAVTAVKVTFRAETPAAVR